MSEFWQCDRVDVRLPTAALDRLLKQATRGRYRSAGTVPAGEPARIILWSSPRPPAEPAVVGMVVLGPGEAEAASPAIRELHWPRTSNELALWRRIERMAGQALGPPRAVGRRA
ncbi:MAG TPA: hypothetical protein VGL23_04875 [Chloroflexota bacterium]|jgi:hypothetical protein